MVESTQFCLNWILSTAGPQSAASKSEDVRSTVAFSEVRSPGRRDQLRNDDPPHTIDRHGERISVRPVPRFIPVFEDEDV